MIKDSPHAIMAPIYIWCNLYFFVTYFIRDPPKKYPNALAINMNEKYV